jgi:hypothetical protein
VTFDYCSKHLPFFSAIYLQAFQAMTTETKTSSALLKWGQETTELDKFLRQIMAIVRALDSQVILLLKKHKTM